MRKMLKKEIGITLVALVVTIIILLILAGVAVSQLSGSGLFIKARQVQTEQKKAQYYEEINIEIYNEHMERYAEKKQTAFITDLDNKIITKDWVNATIKCDEYFEEQENDYQNTILFIETKDGYEIIVDVENNIPEAIIRADYFRETKSKCKVEYDANGGTGNTEAQEVIAGFYTILQNNNFVRTNYSFVGWCKNKDGNDELYAAGSKLKIEENITLYAIWKQEFVTITFDANGGMGIMESSNVDPNISIQLPENAFEKEGYYFVNWNTKADGTGKKYTTSATITENTTLYAQWKQYVTVTFNANGGSGTMNVQNVKQGVATALIKNQYTMSGYGFIKWNTKADGTGTNYTEQAKVTLTKNITLYAIWGDSQLKDWEFSIDDDTEKITLTRYIGSNTDVVIANKYKFNNIEYNTVMGDSAISGGISQNDIPTSYYGPFINNQTIKKITFEDGVTFGTEGIKYAFMSCFNLEEINNIPKVDYPTPHYAWYACGKLKKVKIPEGITKIGSYDFSKCSLLEKVYIPKMVTNIDASVSSTTVIVPFKGSPNVTIYCEANKALSGYKEGWNYYTRDIELPVVYNVTEEAFDNL